MNTNIYFDTEGDGLLDTITKFHVFSVALEYEKPISFRSVIDFLNWLKGIDSPVLWCHNVFDFDLPAMQKVHGIPFTYTSIGDVRVRIFDTLALSRKLFPDRPGGHGLEEWGRRLGVRKPVINDWSGLDYEAYRYRCEQDVLIQRETTLALLREAGCTGVDDMPNYLKIANKTYYLMCQQERNGVYFDQQKARELVGYIDKRMAEIEAEVEPKLPPKKLNKGEENDYTPPKLQFKKDGTPSANAMKWFDSVEQDDDGKWYGEKHGIRVPLPWHKPIAETIPMRLKDQAALKDWLLSLGWRPTFWNYKKDNRGKPIRDSKSNLIKTSPKFHDKGELCPNLQKLKGVDFIPLVCEWLSLRNRRSVIINEDKGTGWLNHPRLAKDGRLPAGSSGLTNTCRQKHRVVANIPRVGSMLGKEMRSLFSAAPGKVFVGFDASGLEARVEAHYTYKYDGGEYARTLLEGDVHTANAIVFYGDEVELDENGKALKKWRDPAKAGKYALTYGSQPPTLASTLGIPEAKAKEVFDNFWQANYALAALRDAVTAYWERTGRKYIVTLDGNKVYTRSKHSLVNALFQSAGACIMDMAGIIMEQKLLKKGIDAVRVVYYHDEYIFECNEEDAEEVLKLGIESIKEAGEWHKLKVQLDADGCVGKTWADVH